MIEANAVLAIAYRDFVKFARDRSRLFATFVLPLTMIGALGGSLQISFGQATSFNLLVFTFTGVYAMTMWQTTASGIISLIQDRETDLTQEIFVSPISRYSIVFGKILGETLVAFPQAIGVVLFGLVIGIGPSPEQLLLLVPTGILAALSGGAFGLLVLSNLSSHRAANQIFPFIFLPQYFLAGVFNPIESLPPVLDVVSHLSPLRYAVDLVRGVFYSGSPAYEHVVLAPPLVNLAVLGVMFGVFLSLGTVLFVNRERNR